MIVDLDAQYFTKFNIYVTEYISAKLDIFAFDEYLDWCDESSPSEWNKFAILSFFRYNK